MNEEPKVSKQITRKLERYLNRERVEQRFDSSGQGLSRTHPLMVKLELAYLIANEDEKKKDGGKPAESPRDSSKNQPMPRIRPLPQKKTRVQMSEIERLAKNAQAALKSVDADKISTVYRFRQQMIPYEVRHQGKVKQVSTSVHAMLNAEEAWRYRQQNDEREKVKKYKEQQRAKAKEREAQEARERELAKLPPGIRTEIKRQQEKRNRTSVLEKLLQPDQCKSSSAPTEDDYSQSEELQYEDDFEEEEENDDDDAIGCRVGNTNEQEPGDVEDEGMSEDVGGQREEDDENQLEEEDDNDDEVFIAAVTTANDAGSVSSFTPSTYTLVTSRPQSKRSIYEDDAALAYEDESFESGNEDDAEDQSVFLTGVNPGSVGGSRGSSRAPSPTKSTGRLQHDDCNKVTEERGSSETNLKNDRTNEVRGHNRGSGEVKQLANQLARTVVRSAAKEEGVSYSSMSSIRSDRSNVTSIIAPEVQGQVKKREKTQEYTRTESVISLSDRVKRDLDEDT